LGIKRKGSYAYKRPNEEGAEIGWHADHSALVVRKAAEHALLYDGDIEDFIINHDNIYDFMLRVKVQRSHRLVLHVDGEDVDTQNTVRYYISNSGGKLVKIMPPTEEGNPDRRTGIDKDWEVTLCNNMKDFRGDINYEYYIQEAKKLVDPILGGKK